MVVLIVAAQNETMWRAAAIRVETHDVALLVNRARLRAADRTRIVNRRETTVTEKKPMRSSAGIHEESDHAPFGVDAERKGAVHPVSIVEVGKPALRTPLRKESVRIASAIGKIAGEIALGVPLGSSTSVKTPSCSRTVRREAAIEKRSHDVASFVDTVSGGVVCGARVIDRAEDAVAK